MVEILQNQLPDEMTGAVRLPGVAPCGARDWLRVDEVYAAQMAYRARLLEQKREQVLWMAPNALEAAQEVLAQVLELLPELGFQHQGGQVRCPDGRKVAINGEDPLHTLGHLVQEDICILQKHGDEHVLTGAILCFPSNWRLAEKAAKPLTDIHMPVVEYAGDIARRVQRLFDGVKHGRPLWRFNRLRYALADLHQPRRVDPALERPLIRSERQCIIRMPVSDAVVFTIHTWVVKPQAL